MGLGMTIKNETGPQGQHVSWAVRLRRAEAAHVRALRERDEARETSERRRRKLAALQRRIDAIVSAVAAADEEIGRELDD